MATAQAVQTSTGNAIVPRPADAMSHTAANLEAIECRRAETPHVPDQITLVLLVGCVLLILAMNLFDVVTGMLNW